MREENTERKTERGREARTEGEAGRNNRLTCQWMRNQRGRDGWTNGGWMDGSSGPQRDNGSDVNSMLACFLLSSLYRQLEE